MDIAGKTIDLKGVLFDLDGTLIDSQRDIAAAANAARAHFGLPPVPVEEVLPFVGFGIRHLIEGVLKTQDPARIAEGLEATLRYYGSHLGVYTVVYDGGWDLLEALKGRGIACGVVSNKPHDLTVRTLAILKMEGYFSAAFGEDPRMPKKPRPEPVFAALERMGVSAADAVFVGDSAVDVECAKNAGMPCIVVTHGFGDKDALERSAPDLVVGSLRELVGLLK